MRLRRDGQQGGDERRKRGSRGRIARALIGLGLTVAAVAATGTQALADSKPVGPAPPQPGASVPAGFADWNQLWAYQARLDAAAERILAAGGAGNASIVADPTSHELRVYWHGTVPAAVRTTAGWLDVPVTFHPAAFTHQELVAEAKRLAGVERVVRAAPVADGSGLAVTVDATLAPATQSSLRAGSRVPLTITTGKRSRAAVTATRQADTAPFWGGSRYHALTGDCTNGIAVKLNSVAYMMTAAHCSSDGASVTVPGQPGPTGFVSNTNACRDTALLRYPAGVDSPIYTGPFNSSSASNAIVAGATPDFVGNLVVTGGASSGEHFNIRVNQTDVFEGVGGVKCDVVGPLTDAFSMNNTCAQAPGDSGGPVYSYLNGRALMRGTITGGNSGVACPGVVAVGGFEVIYAPLVRPPGDAQIGSLSFYGAAVLGVPIFDLNGTWTDGRGANGRAPGPVISVVDRSITVDMSRLNRPTAHGTFIDETHISVTFPDDRTYTAQLLAPRSILWSNNSLWEKL
jgi:hypothetical protein